jgi:hypothetical protein
MTPRFDSDDDEHERPNWREIDRRRDRSRHSSGERRSRKEQTLRSTWAKQQYLKEADKLFQGVKGRKDHKAALDAIHRTYGTSRFAASVKKYLSAYGLPAEWGTLMLFLDYKDDRVVAETVEALKLLASERTAVEREGFKNKLEILTLTAPSTAIASLAEAALREL